MKTIENKTFDEERALYESHDILVRNSAFDGPADGESALKESSNIQVEHVFCNLRYPFWHDHGLTIRDSEMTELCRAALWYSDQIEITDTKMHGIKALRECSDVTVKNSVVKGEYLAWYSDGLTLINCKIIGTQPFCYCRNLKLIDCEMIDTDLCFEKSDVDAVVTTPVISIKNPASGRIQVPALGELIHDDKDSRCEVIIQEQNRNHGTEKICACA